MNQKQIHIEGKLNVFLCICVYCSTFLLRKLSTAIVTRGTLRKGAVLVSGLAHAKVRGLFDHNGKPMTEAPPGTPVEILGWRELPLAGDIILEVESEVSSKRVYEIDLF